MLLIISLNNMLILIFCHRSSVFQNIYETTTVMKKINITEFLMMNNILSKL